MLGFLKLKHASIAEPGAVASGRLCQLPIEFIRSTRATDRLNWRIGNWQFPAEHVLIEIKMSGVTRRIVRAGGWKVAKRIIKPIPLIGSVFAFGLAGYEIKRKGLIPGAVHVGLDITPIIGTAKGVLEIFTGDLIPDKKDRKKTS
jgi:hypothetical protein